MTTGPDNLGNGAAKTEDRFAGQLGYRPRGSRDGGSLPAGRPINGSHDGTLTGSLGLPLSGGTRNNGTARSGSSLNGGSLSNPLDSGPLGSTGLPDLGAPLHTENPIASTLTEPKLPDTDPVESDLSFRDSPKLMGSESWLEKDVVDHPLLRGLLLELPPKGSTMQVQWLDRWFEAARSIMELLYRFDGKRD